MLSDPAGHFSNFSVAEARRRVENPQNRVSPERAEKEKTPGISMIPGVFVVSDTGIEPATSSVSGKRATAAPIAQTVVPVCRAVR